MKLRFDDESIGVCEINPPGLVPYSDDWSAYNKYMLSAGPTTFTLRVKGDLNISPSPDTHEFVLGDEQKSIRFQGIVSRIEDVLIDADDNCPPHRFSRNLRVDKQLSGVVILSGGHDCVMTLA